MHIKYELRYFLQCLPTKSLTPILVQPDVLLNLRKIIQSSCGMPITHVRFNPLNTKRRLLYSKTQFVPRSKHFSSRL